MTSMYILEGKTPVPCDDIKVWGKWMETADRKVARTVIGGAVVSTVFLGLDHNFYGGVPVLFETMVFDSDEEMQRRCSTWEQAETMHEAVCQLVQLTAQIEGSTE